MADKNEAPDLLEKMFLLGVGAFSLTKEKVDGVVDDLVARGRLSEEQGDNLVSEIGQKGAEQRDMLQKFMQEQFDRALAAGQVASRTDIKRLEAEIATLRAQIAGETVPVEDFPEDSC